MSYLPSHSMTSIKNVKQINKEICKCYSSNDQFRKYICLTNLNSRSTVWNMIWMLRGSNGLEFGMFKFLQHLQFKGLCMNPWWIYWWQLDTRQGFLCNISFIHSLSIKFTLWGERGAGNKAGLCISTQFFPVLLLFWEWIESLSDGRKISSPSFLALSNVAMELIKM